MPERRLFYALWPSERQRESLREAIGFALGEVEGRVQYRGLWHVTLAYLGNIDEARIPELHAAGAGIVVEPFRLRFDRLEFWPRPRIACLAASSVPSPLIALVNELAALARRFGVEVDGRPFRPHITVAQKATSFATQPLARPLTLDWSEFHLVESLQNGHDARYRPLNQQGMTDS